MVRLPVAEAAYQSALPVIMKRKSISLIASFIFFALVVLPTRGEAGKDVNVLILRSEGALNIDGAGRGKVTLRRLRGTKKVLVNGKQKTLPQSFSARRGEFIYLNKRPYRGRLTVHGDKTSSGGLLVVNELGIEEYIGGIINYEISSAWPREVVKAQAVAARTYVLYRISREVSALYDIEGTTAGQVYKGAAAEDEASLAAVKECGGEVLTYNGEPALTVYHSNSGGRTDAASDIWQGGAVGEYPYLRSVPSPHDGDKDPRYRWDFAVPAVMFGKILHGEGFRIGTPRKVVLGDLTSGGRAREVRITDKSGKTLRLRVEELRRLIGYSILRSAVLTVRRDGGLFIFRGRGSGHGVGMSQWGARGMAEAGASYKEILRHYYRGARLEKLF